MTPASRNSHRRVPRDAYPYTCLSDPAGTVGTMSAAIAITGAHVVPVVGDPFDGTVLMHGGRIAAMGADVSVPADATIIDAGGRWVLPGFIDAHTHLGVHEEAEGWAGSDTNELTDR